MIGWIPPPPPTWSMPMEPIPADKPAAQEAAELLCVAYDYLIQHWDMDAVPLNEIKAFVERYVKENS